MTLTTRRHALLLSLDDDAEEITQLAGTLDIDFLDVFVQHRDSPDPHTYIGSGKLQELLDFLEKTTDVPIDLVIVDGELKPTQWFALERRLHLPVSDRLRLILDIFSEHADSREAKLQVQLAQLQYERPLIKELIHRSRMGEHPGLMSGGEYQVNDYYEMIKRQQKKIRARLTNIKTDRCQRRKNRHESGFFMIALAGYTNAGKSSLLNVLSGGDVKVKEQLFSTLSTTTRRIPLDQQKNTLPILLTDTVGFIDNLPSWVIEAFHSTLEEIQQADLVLLVIDASEDLKTIRRKLAVSIAELSRLHSTESCILALNKMDLCTSEHRELLVASLEGEHTVCEMSQVLLSTCSKEGVDDLIAVIHEMLDSTTSTLTLPNVPEVQSFLNLLYLKAQVHDIKYLEDNTLVISFTCNNRICEKLLVAAAKYQKKN